MMTSLLSAPPLSTGVNEQHWMITRYSVCYVYITHRALSGQFILLIYESVLLPSLCGAAGLFWVQTIDSSLLATLAIALASRRSDGGLGPLTLLPSRSALTRPGSAHKTLFIGHRSKNAISIFFLFNHFLPRDMMKGQHIDPEEAVKIHQDLQAKQSVAIHWGTFALAYEVRGGGRRAPSRYPRIYPSTSHLSLPPEVPY